LEGEREKGEVKNKNKNDSPWVVVGAVVLNGLNKRMRRRAKTKKRRERERERERDFEAK
jgi:hypothetical protein